jgi:glycosyltransferase involved in cell wall biosynthesis
LLNLKTKATTINDQSQEVIQNAVKPAFSIVVPCFNEEAAIAQTVHELCDSIPGSVSYELIVVDDGSHDGTAEILRNLAEKTPALRIVSHARNRGYGAALKSGIAQATAEIIAITDADGTYPNERIPEFVEACKNYDMVVGSRTSDDVEYSNIRKIPKMFLKAWVSWIVRQHVPDINSGMRVFRKDLAESYFGILPNTFSFTITITLAMMTNYRRVHFIPISYRKRTGRSKIKPIRDTMRFLLLILRTGTYFAPLRMLAPFIAILGLLAFGSLCYDIFAIQNLTDKTVMLFLFTFNTGMFALLADMIDKRTGR